MTGIYSTIDSTNENQVFNVISNGSYTLTPAPTNVFELLTNGSYDIAVISFVDANAGSTSADADWLKAGTDSLSQLYTEIDPAKVLVAAILYRSDVTGTYPYGDLAALACTPFFSGSASYFKARNAYFLANGPNAAGPAAHFRDGIGAGATPPFTYVVRRTTGFIADKIHRAGRYNGEPGYLPTADLLRMGWDVVPATNAQMKDYLKKRLLNDHLAITPSLSVRPTPADNLAGGAYPKVVNGSVIRCAFSEKAVGAGTNTSYVFNDGSLDQPNLIQGIGIYDVTWAGYTGATPAQTEQDLDRTFAGLAAGKTLTLNTPSAGLLDTTGIGFTSSAVFETAAAGDTPTCDLKVNDGTTTFDLMLAGALPVLTSTTRTLTARVVTAFPTYMQPTGRVIRPDGSSVALAFAAYAATLDLSLPDLEGVYTVIVDAYTNNAGNSIPQTIRRFIVAENIAANTKTRTVEGWGYYPREEGLPTTASEKAAALAFGDAGWAYEGAAAISAPAGARLKMPAAAAGECYARSYTSVFGTDGVPPALGNGASYIEAGFALASPPPPLATKAVLDQDGNPLTLTVLGVGLEIWNGPLKLSVLVVDTGTGPRLAVRVLWTNDERYRLSSVMIDPAKFHIVRAVCNSASGQYTVLHAALDPAVPPATPMAFPDSFNVARSELVTTNASLYKAGARFGVLDVSNQAVDCEWEFVRYGFLDANYASPAGNTSLIGMVHTMRAGETAWYRSPDILIGGSSTADPADGVANAINVGLTVGTLPSLTSQIPYKVRFFAVDWNDPAGPGSPSGFNKANFPSCYQAAAPAGFAAVSPGPSAVAGRATGGVSASAATQWQFDVHRERQARRIFILAYVDSPLMPTPVLLPTVAVSSLLVDDGAAKSDYRCAVRQFLPDYYVQDMPNNTDPATFGLTGGWLSPDVAIGVYKGPMATGTHAAPDPRALGETLFSSTVEATYPLGFAQGFAHDAYLDLTGSVLMPAYDKTADTGAGITIAVTDTGCTDYDGAPAQCYFNRIWVRLSNKGVVPGPANVQIFFLDSSLFNYFYPGTVRPDPTGHPANSDFHWIWSDLANTKFVQSTFQRYMPRGTPNKFDIDMVNAVPALSGWSNPGGPGNFVIAEFVWHVAQSAVSADIHGCRAICINLPGQTPQTAEAQSSGMDEVPASIIPDPSWPGDKSIWLLNAVTNNVAVRNSNIVQGAVPPDLPVNVKCLVNPQGEPQQHRRFPNNFRLGSGKTDTIWGIKVEGKKFPAGELILRVPSAIAVNAKPKGFVELVPDVIDALTGKPAAWMSRFHPEDKSLPYRYFRLKGGETGILERISVAREILEPSRLDPNDVHLYFRPYAKAAPGVYEVTIMQIAGGKPVGGYRTTVIVPKPGGIRFVADARTKVLYDARKYPWVFESIAYANRADFTGPGLALQERFRFGLTELIDLITGKLKNEIVNVPRGYKYPPVPEVVDALPGGLMGAVVGRILDVKGNALAGLDVVLHDTAQNRELGRAATDYMGCYLILVKADGKTIPTKLSRRVVELSAQDPKNKEKQARMRLNVEDLCFAAKEIRLKV